MNLIKYPRTHHVTGSRLQSGDEDLALIPAADLLGKHLVIEEKVDGANSALSFSKDAALRIQSRGHYLQGGPRETQFTLLKQWAATLADDLYSALGDRYIAYGEWLYAKHTVFYDRLPHYWMEFDILDRQRSTSDRLHFLDTPARAALLTGLPITQVRTLWSGTWTRDHTFSDFLRPSAFKSPDWRETLISLARQYHQPECLILKHTDPSDIMEGLYIKWEDDGQVLGRYKFVRRDFISLLTTNDEHPANLAILPNQLAPGVNLFGGIS